MHTTRHYPSERHGQTVTTFYTTVHTPIPHRLHTTAQIQHRETSISPLYSRSNTHSEKQHCVPCLVLEAIISQSHNFRTTRIWLWICPWLPSLYIDSDSHMTPCRVLFHVTWLAQPFPATSVRVHLGWIVTLKPVQADLSLKSGIMTCWAGWRVSRPVSWLIGRLKEVISIPALFQWWVPFKEPSYIAWLFTWLAIFYSYRKF